MVAIQMLTTNSFKSPLIEFVVLVVGQEICLLQTDEESKTPGWPDVFPTNHMSKQKVNLMQK